MEILGTLALLTALAGPPAGVRQASAADFDFAGAEESPCIPKQGIGVDTKFAAECERMSEPEYYRGKWRAEFESSLFSFSGRKDCWEERGQACIDLVGEGLPPLGRWACTREFEIEFIGRRSLHAVMEYGVPAYLVVADKLISAKRLPDPYHPDCDPKLHPQLKAK